MKETKENVRILKLLGFEKVKGNHQEGWWILGKYGQQFNTSAVKDFKTLLQNLLQSEFERGQDYEWQGFDQ